MVMAVNILGYSSRKSTWDVVLCCQLCPVARVLSPVQYLVSKEGKRSTRTPRYSAVNRGVHPWGIREGTSKGVCTGDS